VLIREKIAEELKARRANYTDFNTSDDTCEALAAWISDIVKDLWKDEVLLKTLAPRVEGLVHNQDDGIDTTRQVLNMLSIKMINQEV
jgi:hypothetical protein